MTALSDGTLDTIVALATAPEPAGIAVIRISGSLTSQIISLIFTSKKSPTSFPRLAIYGKLVDKKRQLPLDTGMCLFFKSPNSYTGEDVAELHFHGSPLIAQKLIKVILDLGARLANPGEFTERAYLNNKLDLIQAESVCDLINSTSEEALKIANEQINGRLSKVVDSVGEPLRAALAQLEAYIDFPEEDIEPEVLAVIVNKVKLAEATINKLVTSFDYGMLVKSGLRVLLCGPPNAGKSSLLNKLLGTNRAIVSPKSGTTRDLIEEKAQLHGYNFVFCDSAGIREAQDEIEQIGIELAIERLNWADLILVVVDTTAVYPQDQLELLKSKLSPYIDKLCLVRNKFDLSFNNNITPFKISESTQSLTVSCKLENGIDSLIKFLVDFLASKNSLSSESNEIITNKRHHQHLTLAQKHLDEFLANAQVGLGREYLSENIRVALANLSEIVGHTSNEDILERIFSQFCIGK
jgi:tRNA modification GTPase